MTEYRRYPGSAYQVSFVSTDIVSGMTLFPLRAGAGTRVVVEEIFVSALSSDPGTALFSLYRGSTTAIRTASLADIVTLDGWSGAGTAGSLAQTPAPVVDTASATLVDQRGMTDGFHYRYAGETDNIVAPGQRIDLIITEMPKGLNSFSGTMKIREIGKNPIS